MAIYSIGVKENMFLQRTDIFLPVSDSTRLYGSKYQKREKWLEKNIKKT